MTDDLLEHFEEAAQKVVDESQLAPEDLKYLQDLGSEYASIQLKLDTIENERKLLQARKQELQEVLIPDAMRAKSLVNAETSKGKFHLADGSIIYLKKETYASVPADKRAAFLAWITENDLRDQMLTYDIPKSRLNDFSKRRLQAGLGPPTNEKGEELMTMYTVVKAQMTKGR